MVWKLVQLFAINSTKGDGMNVLENKQLGNRELRETVIHWLTQGKPLNQTFRDTNIKKDLANSSTPSLQL
jgi:hypothetical protein